MVVIIKGIKYNVRILSKKSYTKKYSNSYAHVNRDSREIIFRDDHIKKTTVIHEVTHAFINTLCLGSCNDLTLEDFEEIICEMLEVHLMDINRVSNEILSFLKEPKK